MSAYCFPSSSSLHLRSNREFYSLIKPPYPHSQPLNNLKISTTQLNSRRRLYSVRRINKTVFAVHASPWDDKPYRILTGGEISYYDESDVVSFLDPPKQLIPLDPSSYNPAAYLWYCYFFHLCLCRLVTAVVPQNVVNLMVFHMLDDMQLCISIFFELGLVIC